MIGCIPPILLITSAHLSAGWLAAITELIGEVQWVFSLVLSSW